MAQSGRLKLGDNIYGHYKSIFNHCDVIGGKAIEFGGKNAKQGLLCRSRSFKVIDFVIYLFIHLPQSIMVHSKQTQTTIRLIFLSHFSNLLY